MPKGNKTSYKSFAVMITLISIAFFIGALTGYKHINQLPALKLIGDIDQNLSLRAAEVGFMNSVASKECTKFTFGLGEYTADFKKSTYRPTAHGNKYDILIPLTWKGHNKCGWRPVSINLLLEANESNHDIFRLPVALEEHGRILTYQLADTSELLCTNNVARKILCKAREIYSTSNAGQIGFGITERVLHIRATSTDITD